MSLPSQVRLEELLRPFLTGWPASRAIPAGLYEQLGAYLDLLVRWNRRMNLTAVRDPEEMVVRHFGESLFAGSLLASRLATAATLLDLGSGAGFPGLPIQLLVPELSVTLAESQAKKAAFLREAVRILGLQAEVWSARVETMPRERRFGCVALRAVDRMETAVAEAERRTSPGGWLAVLGTDAIEGERIAIPGSNQRAVILRRIGCNVPRGTFQDE